MLLCACLWTAAAGADPQPLGTVVQRLNDQGKHVVFNTNLVTPDTPVDLEAISIRDLDRALADLGLMLQRVGDHWVIVRASVAAGMTAGASIRLEIRSSAGRALQNLLVTRRGEVLAAQRLENHVWLIPATPGTLVSIGASGHEPSLVRLQAAGQALVLQHAELVENVIVTGSRHRVAGYSTTGSLHVLDASDLTTVPTLGNDALRAAAQLPGMSSMGVSAKPRIRGGLQDELLVRLDGIELLDAYHLADFQNIFSVIDDRAVESVDVYTGGFPVRYGNRMSGVMEITTRTPATVPTTELGISVFSLLANSQGLLPGGNADYMVSVRRGTLDQIIDQVNPDVGRPRYYDAFGRIERRLSEGTRVSAGVFFTRDDVTLHDDDDETSARSNIDTGYLWTRLQQSRRSQFDSVSTLTYTWSDRSKILSDLDDDSPQAGFLDHRQRLRKVHLRSDLRVHIDPMLMELGAEVEYGSTRYDSTAWVNRNLLGTLLQAEATDGHEIHVDPDGLSGGAYWAAEIPLGQRILIQPGIRWDFQAFDPDGPTYHVSPRLGVQFDPLETLTVRLDVGRFHQPEALHELQAADGEASYFRPQSSDHFIVGVQWLGPDGWSARLEHYDKRYRRTKTRYENLFNPFVLVPELEPDRISVDPERARARGFDLEVRKQLTSRATARLSYGYMDARDRLNGRWIPRRWSQRHTVSGMLSWQGASTTAAVAVTWHSGWRGIELPDTVAPDTVLDVTGLMNQVDLRDYVSVDASVRRTWRIGRSEVTAFASITNLTDRNNIAGFDYEAEDMVAGRYLVEREHEALMPLVPSLGVLITF